MNKSQFLNKLLSYPNVKVVNFNSNNLWGFGGAIGKRYFIDNLTVTIATASYRHLPSHDFIRLDTPEKYGYVDTEPNTKQMDGIINIINKHLKGEPYNRKLDI